MKKISLIALMLSLALSACKKEESVQENPNNPSNPTPTDSRDVFVGNYVMLDSVFLKDGVTGIFNFDRVENYILSIEKADSSNQILLIGYLNTSDTLLAVVAGSNVSIPYQVTNFNAGIESDGLGSVSNDNLTLNTKYWSQAVDQYKVKGKGVK